MKDLGTITLRWEWQQEGNNPLVGFVNEHCSLRSGFDQWGPMSLEAAEWFIATRKAEIDALRESMDIISRKHIGLDMRKAGD